MHVCSKEKKKKGKQTDRGEIVVSLSGLPPLSFAIHVYTHTLSHTHTDTLDTHYLEGDELIISIVHRRHKKEGGIPLVDHLCLCVCVCVHV